MTYSLITRAEKGSKLSSDDMDGNLLYLQNLGLMATNTTNRILDDSSNGSTILVTDYILFCNSGYGYVTVYLPSASSMQGKQLIFINTNENSEGSFIINGTFMGSSSYNLNTWGHSVTILSDGSTWWITQQYIP